MAPNQKSLAHITESLSNLDLSNLVNKSEFLPLTHPKEAEQAEALQQTEVKVTPPSSDDYWSWTPSVEVAQAQETISASRIEEQLIRDAQRRSLKVETIRASDDDDDAPAQPSVDYWDEAPPETDTAAAANETSCFTTTSYAQHEYWQWTSDAKDVFSVESIQDNLICQYAANKTSNAKALSSSASSGVTTVPANYWDEATPAIGRATPTSDTSYYWDWPSDDDVRAEFIRMILQQVDVRRLCSTRHLQTNLVRQASDDYWKESSSAVQETMSDTYWNWESSSQTQQAVTTYDVPSNYWDW